MIAIVQSRDAYRKSTDAAEWSGGQFDGKIRVPVFDPQVLDQGMLRSLAHETTPRLPDHAGAVARVAAGGDRAEAFR